MPQGSAPGERRGGRQKGTPNKVTPEVRELARSLFDKAYWDKKRTMLTNGELPPQIEAKLLAYAYGEPKQEKSNQGGITINLGVITRDQPTIAIASQPLQIAAENDLRNDSAQTSLAIVVNEAG